jgi:DNA-binding transcriptional ArsR family regulator
MPAAAAADSLSLTFSALADPTRRAILARLATGDLSVSEIAEPFDMSMPAISKHLRVLERAKLITRTRDAQFRPCHLTPEPLHEVMEFARAYERFWASKVDSLDAYLKTLQKKQKAKHDKRR